MDWYESVFELIDMRSFSNLWFWIALAVLWSSVSHWVLGVPWDMVLRARKEGEGEAVEDLQAMVRINVNRILYIAGQSGLLITGFACFALTMMAILGFFYRNEFAQALFLLGFPMSIVGLLSVATARKIRVEEPAGEALYKRLVKHRIITQGIGMLSIFVTAIWGMLQNMTASVLF
ncbi:component of SufBCD complex [Roseovarius faecimaris]|uniref:Component of SufBCD complex n=1 Tax=Roseovarius faecimaris TaxID=2494550 RepID=A0A6I6IN33_9RHOB|nr:component of SufBCD complex [Roseovarius faecimaris]QGX98520.1 component of SufBCD complex [Roseovarius faecimaris]